MPIRDVIDLARVEQVIGGFISSHFGGDVGVVWANQAVVRATAPFVELLLIAPPQRRSQPIIRRATVPSSVRVVITNTDEDNAERLLFVNGCRLSGSGDTDNAARDALITAVNASYERVTASSTGAGQLDIVADELGALQSIRGIPSADIAITTLAESDVEYLISKRRAVLSINVYATRSVGSASAGVIMQDLLLALEDPAVREANFLPHGIGISSISPARDLSQLEGTFIESRQQVEIALNLEARSARAATYIEAVEFTDETADPPNTRIVEIGP